MTHNKIPEEDLLLEAARTCLDKAYAPYSGIRVAAAVLTKTGSIYTGCNVENSSYSLTICAERNCLFQAISHGEREFIAMAVISDSELVISPCGACRQVLAEFTREMPIIVVNPQRAHYYHVDELLPEIFSLKD